jgi:hypothetical protein
MLLIGFRNINTSTGNTEDSLGHVTHQRVDIIADSHIYNTHTLRELYFSMLERAEESSKKLQKLRQDLEFSDMSIDEFEKLEDELLGHMQILKYHKVIVVEGSVLK